MQELLCIHGPCAISGSLTVQGSKNSMLPILAGILLRPGKITLQSVPQISDKDAVCQILTHLGCEITQTDHTLIADSQNAAAIPIPPKLMAQTRGAFVLLGAMLARFHQCEFSTPGGCALGKRPINYHIDALQQMGVCFTESSSGHLKASCVQLKGAHIVLPFPSVGATENILLAACGAQGKTLLDNAACEPEILDLIAFLKVRGFPIQRTGLRQYCIIGNPELTKLPLSGTFKLMPDRIAAATYLCAATATGGTLTLQNISPEMLPYALPIYQRAGCFIEAQPGKVGLTLHAPKQLSGVGAIITAPYPGFATDMQPLFLAMLCQAEGSSSFTESIFENRFTQVAQLVQMGAQITIRGKTATIQKKGCLHGRHLLATDLRGGAALTIAALAAEGESILHGMNFISRGYEAFPKQLQALHADIKPISEAEISL